MYSQSIHTFNIVEFNKNIFNSYQFITENSKDISIKFIKYAESVINRIDVVEKFFNIIQNVNISSNLEKGIFEYSLLHVITNNLEQRCLQAIYEEKVYDIFVNINGDKKINNNTLKEFILSNHIKPQLVAFLSPQQLHPAKWADLINKKKIIAERENSIAYTSQYRCKKCGEKKAKVTELQIRCADEPSSKFIT